MEEKVKYRISTGLGIFFIILAGVADLATLIPFVGDFLGWAFWAIMAVVFWKLGLGLVNWRRLIPALISTIAELFPAVQALPTIIVAMIAILLLTRIEDKTGLKILPSKGKPGITPPRIQRRPMNSTPGIRPPRNN